MSVIEPWIFSGSIKENILFGLDYDEEKFNQCVYAAALDTVCLFVIIYKILF
jgi:ABC-type multidrug transport system fused ATPase/permease subunit